MISLSTPRAQDIAVHFPYADGKRMTLHVRQFSTLHPEISGNKWFKLLYWLKDLNTDEKVLSFGGAFSNHLLAVSAAGQALGISTQGILRGEEVNNPWIRAMRKNGMELHFISREAYRKKTEPSFVEELQRQFGPCRIVPEGGAGLAGIAGAAEMVQSTEPYDWIILPGGTGTTAAGIAHTLRTSSCKVLCFQVLKGDGILQQELLQSAHFRVEDYPNLHLQTDYHFGGYAKSNNVLREFQKHWLSHTHIPIDLVYGAKALYGVSALLQAGTISPTDRLLYIHTGGMGPV